MRFHCLWKKEASPIQVHKTFIYLDDSLTVDSLSAIEAGRIDKVVEKINHAKLDTRTSSSGMTFAPKNRFKISASGTRTEQSNLSLQEEVVRRRTSVSIFEQWYQAIKKKQAILEVKEWDTQQINRLYPGELIQFTGTISVSPVEACLRTLVEMADQAISGNPLFEKMLDAYDENVQAQASSSVSTASHDKEAHKRQLSAAASKRNNKIAQLKNMKNIILSLLGDGETIHGLVSPHSQGKNKEVSTKIGIRIKGEWAKEIIGSWKGQYTLLSHKSMKLYLPKILGKQYVSLKICL